MATKSQLYRLNNRINGIKKMLGDMGYDTDPLRPECKDLFEEKAKEYMTKLIISYNQMALELLRSKN